MPLNARGGEPFGSINRNGRLFILQSIPGVVEVDDHQILIKGSKDLVEQPALGQPR